MRQKKDVLIALINNKEDFGIAHQERWSLIPVQSAPRILSEKRFQKLPQPIISRRHRRVLFITVTFSRFEAAKELNDVFKERSIEEKLWETIISECIEA